MIEKKASPGKMVVIGSFVVFVFVAAALFFYARWGFGSDITIEKNNMILAKKMKSAEITSADGQDSMKYRLFVPDNLEDKKYPLVVWLHGAGGRGSDNLSHLDDGVGAFLSYEVQRHQPSFVLAPQCPDSRQWVDMADSGPPYVNYELDSVPESVWFQLLFQIISELEEKYPIDVNRRYVSGFSMGAAGVWDIITRHPDFFAAAMPVTGKGDPSKADRLVSIPIWAFHGKFDPIAPVENTRALAGAIQKAGGTKLKVTELWRKHYILQHVFKDFEPFRWLFQQRKGGSRQ
jgi:predicted peptidase